MIRDTAVNFHEFIFEVTLHGSAITAAVQQSEAGRVCF